MYIGPHGCSVLCSCTIFIDEYFLPLLVIVYIIDLIDQGPWESTKRTAFHCESILIITQKGQAVAARSATRGLFTF